MSSQRIVDEFRVYEVQWTKHKTQKRKVWVEGTLVHHLWNGRVVLRDSNGYEIERPFIGKKTIEVDKEVELDKHLVLVEDLKETGRNDITDSVQAKSQPNNTKRPRTSITPAKASSSTSNISPLKIQSSSTGRVTNTPFIPVKKAPLSSPLVIGNGMLKKPRASGSQSGRILNQSSITPQNTASKTATAASSSSLSVRKRRPLLSLQRKKTNEIPPSTTSPDRPSQVLSQSAMTNRRGLLSLQRQKFKPPPSVNKASEPIPIPIPEEDTLVALLDDQILSQRQQLVPPATDRFNEAENNCPPPSTQFVPSASQLHLNQPPTSNASTPPTKLPETGPWSAEAFELFKTFELPEEIKTKFSALAINPA